MEDFMEIGEFIELGGREYRPIRLLGKGKGGYSYLALDSEGGEYVLKQIHHEPCDYYTFGDKLGSELRDYERLSQLGIRMPKLIFADREREIILKEYIEGSTASELVTRGEMGEEYIEQVREMCRVLYPAGLNIDYYPTNFVLRGGLLYYIDYECNGYMDEWSFENWGIKYWR